MCVTTSISVLPGALSATSYVLGGALFFGLSVFVFKNFALKQQYSINRTLFPCVIRAILSMLVLFTIFLFMDLKYTPYVYIILLITVLCVAFFWRSYFILKHYQLPLSKVLIHMFFYEPLKLTASLIGALASAFIILSPVFFINFVLRGMDIDLLILCVALMTGVVYGGLHYALYQYAYKKNNFTEPLKPKSVILVCFFATIFISIPIVYETVHEFLHPPPSAVLLHSNAFHSN